MQKFLLQVLTINSNTQEVVLARAQNKENKRSQSVAERRRAVSQRCPSQKSLDL